MRNREHNDERKEKQKQVRPAIRAIRQRYGAQVEHVEDALARVARSRAAGADAEMPKKKQKNSRVFQRAENKELKALNKALQQLQPAGTETTRDGAEVEEEAVEMAELVRIFSIPTPLLPLLYLTAC